MLSVISYQFMMELAEISSVMSISVVAFKLLPVTAIAPMAAVCTTSGRVATIGPLHRTLPAVSTRATFGSRRMV
jgi:hypothetical protein